jgi:hypothetical protein
MGCQARTWSHRLLPALLIVLGFAASAAGQVFQAQAGASTLYESGGGSLTVQANRYDLTVGAGTLDSEFRVGGRVRTTVGAAQITLGDDALDFQLPTDLFGGAHYVPTRGAGVAYTRPRYSVFGFAGATSTPLGSPFFRAATWGDPAGMLFADRRLGKQWRALSRNVISRELTSLHGVEWQPWAALRVAGLAGAGGGRPYSSLGAAFDRPRLKASAAYIATDAGFRRVALTSVSSTENVGANFAVDVRPVAGWNLTAAHQNALNPGEQNPATSRVAVNQVGGGLSAAGFRVTAGFYDARRGDATNRGSSLAIGRAVGQRLDVVASTYRSVSDDGRTTTSVVGTFRETIGPRLSLVQLVTNTGRETSVNVGGTLLSNVVSASVDYQTIYAPFRIEDPFIRVMTVAVKLQARGNWQLSLASSVLPDGTVRYTVGANQFFHRGQGNGSSPGRFDLPRFVAHGKVVDQAGRPVVRAVLRIGGVVVLTGDDGRFFTRMKRSSAVPMEVLTSEFPPPGAYDVVKAPLMITPTAQENGEGELVVVSRRVARVLH